MDIETLNQILSECQECNQSDNCDMNCKNFELRFAYFHQDIPSIENWDMTIDGGCPRGNYNE